MSRFDLQALLELISIPLVGPTRLRKLISVLGSPEAVLQASYRQLVGVEGIDQKTAQSIKAGPDREFVSKQLRRVRQYGVNVLTYWDDEYPDALKRIYDPPAFLFYKGTLQALQNPAVAIVGTRIPSNYGRLVAEKFARVLAQNKFAIISGFARGIDTIAHKTALQNNAFTIAVLGNGIDVVYPPENIGLFKQMVEHGLILTEYPMGTRPDAGNFPKRNRIISGISIGVLVAEAGAKSGALLTALYANDQNREVFAVPGSVLSAKSAGCHKLIKEGATLVEDPQEIVEALAPQMRRQLDNPARPVPQLQGNLKKIYDVLSGDPLHVDQIAFQTHLSPAETLSSLLMLELMGLIRQMAGKMFVRL